MKISLKNRDKILTIFDNYQGQEDKIFSCLEVECYNDILIILLTIINNLIKENSLYNNWNAINNMLDFIKCKLLEDDTIDKLVFNRKLIKILESINTFLLEEKFDSHKKKEIRSICYHLSRKIMRLPLEENENTKYLEILWAIITEVKNIDYLTKSIEILNVENLVFRNGHTLIMELVLLYLDKFKEFYVNYEDIKYYNSVIKLILFNKFWQISEVEKAWCLEKLENEFSIFALDAVKSDELSDLIHSFNYLCDSSKILYDLSVRYSVNVQNSTLSIPSCIINQRFTRRVKANDYIITIDSPDTREIDDGLSCQKLENGDYLLGIHITDVFGYLDIVDPIIEEAMQRGETLYLQDLLIYMLPKEFSTDKASLLENKSRFADSHYFQITKDGKIVSDIMMKTIIQSNKKATYEEVNKDLHKRKSETSLYLDTLKNLKAVEKILENKLFRNMNHNISQGNIAEKIVTYAMILENVSMAEFFHNKKLPLIYRVCKENDKYLNFNITDDEKINEELDKILHEVRKNSSKVIYGLDGCHSELGFASYCHSTSPLRRFSDLWNRYLNTVFRTKNIDNEKLDVLTRKTKNIIDNLNCTIEHINYFTIEYNQKVKQPKIINTTKNNKHNQK